MAWFVLDALASVVLVALLVKLIFGGVRGDAKPDVVSIRVSSETQAKLDNLDLTGARFVKASMEKCKFSNCIMNGADLSEASLKGSRWEASNNTRTESIKKTEDEMYRGIIFKGANLSSADVYHIDFTGSDFTGAILDGARTENAVGLPGK